MARYNEILTGRHNKFLTKVFGMKGPAPSPQLAGDITSTINFFSGVENRYLESWERFGIAIVVAGVAANNSVVRFRNPAGSNLVAVFEKITLAGVATVANPKVEVRAVNTDLGSIQSLANSRFDARSRPTPTLIASFQNTAPFAATVNQWLGTLAINSQLDIIFFDDQEITLFPGDSLTLIETVVNTTLVPSVWWRERFLEDNERT